MRLFVAIVPPEPAVAGLSAALAPLRPDWPGLRWTGPDAWHLTLAFLGQVDESVLPQLRTRLARAAHRHPAPALLVAGAGAFPSARSARVLWAGIGSPPASADPAGADPARPESGPAAPGLRRRPLAALAASVAAGARRAGAPPPDEGRGYRPHLTLARCRQPADVRPLVAALSELSGPAWTARHIHLIASQPAGQPRYITLGSWALR